MNLTKQDVIVLMEAVESWETQSRTNDAMGLMIGALVARSADEHKEVQRCIEKTRRDEQQERQLRKERSIELLAKLLALRDSLDAESFVDSCRNNDA